MSPGGRPRNPGVASYDAIHQRLRAAKGPARAYLCVTCGDPANDWAYDGEDPNATTAVTSIGHRVVYSQNIEHYRPMCRRCHNKSDRKRRG